MIYKVYKKAGGNAYLLEELKSEYSGIFERQLYFKNKKALLEYTKQNKIPLMSL